MNENSEKTEHEEWEMTVQKLGREFEFPKTPQIAEQVHKKLRPKPVFILRPALTLLALLLLSVLFAVPEIRAGVLDYIRLGAGNFMTVSTLTPFPTLDVPQLDEGIEISLEDAAAAVEYELAVPTELGNPTVVYLQQAQLPMVIMVWYAPEAFTASRLMLYTIDSRDMFFKFTPDEPENVRINGRMAFWFSSPHLMEYVEGNSHAFSREVEGNVLVWAENGLTYRLEGEVGLEEAQRIAESMP